MSRIAKNPVALPAGVEFKNDAGVISIKGPLGTLMQSCSGVKVELEDGAVVCRAVEGVANANALSGTYRALVNNMVTGVSRRVSSASSPSLASVIVPRHKATSSI